MVDSVEILGGSGIGTVSPRVFGQFVEHLGRCVYGGTWVGDDAAVATVGGGVRADTVALLRRLSPPVLRWPGGCFAAAYHWEDGVGPRGERPRRRNRFWRQGREHVAEESNEFGTEEFMRLCGAVGAEPYLTVNVGTGSPEEAANWLEYCNHDGDTRYVSRRAAGGSEQPHDVTYWGVGNEPWECGGKFDAAGYAAEYRRFAQVLDASDAEDFMDESGSIELVACGRTEREWNRTVLEAVPVDLVDHLSFHRFYGGVECGSDTGFTREEYYRLLAGADQVGRDVDRVAATIEEYASTDDVGVVVDEWGAWHPLAKHRNGLEQENTVRDALAAASVLDALVERADVVSMANLAQAVNVLQCLVQTDEAAAWPTPTYRVFELYRPHAGATALRSRVETDALEVADAGSVPLVSAAASRRGDETFVTVVNRSLEGVRTVRVDADADAAAASVLFDGQRPDAHSTRESSEAFAPGDLAVEVASDAAVVEVPASSVAAVTLRS